MCILSTEYTGQEQFTGYKIAVKRGNSYYSPATGMKYKIGKVPKIRITRPAGNGWIFGHGEELKDNMNFKENFYGKTGIFRSERDVIRKHRNWHNRSRPHVILKMTIKGNLFNGRYDHNNIIAGDTIVKFKEI